MRRFTREWGRRRPQAIAAARGATAPCIPVPGVARRGANPQHVIYGGLPDDPSRAWISLLLVDEKHQGHGYGRAAVSAVIREQHRRMPPSRELGLSYRPGNRPAENLYASLGFRATGVDDRGNVVAWLTLAQD